MPRPFRARDPRTNSARRRSLLHVERLELRAMLSVSNGSESLQSLVSPETDAVMEMDPETLRSEREGSAEAANRTNPILVPPDNTIRPIAECPGLDPRLCLPQEIGPRRLRSVLHRNPNFDTSSPMPERVPSRVVLLLPYQRQWIPAGESGADGQLTRQSLLPARYLAQFPGPYVP
jgi:hypothetical protein